MALFRKRPVEVEAVRFTGEPTNCIDVLQFMGDGPHRVVDVRGVVMLDIETLEGVMTASVGDWIIRGVAGEYYPCKPDVFARTYDPV